MENLHEGGLNPKEAQESAIRKKKNAYKKIFKNVDESKKKFVDSMISQLAYIEISLEELQNQTINEGYIELFEQGNQSFLREHPAAKSYNSYIKSYITIIKTLTDIVPAAKQCDELQKFLDKKKKL